MSQINWAEVRRSLVALATLAAVMLWSGVALATITQGDFSIFGNLKSQWAGRWGEGSDVGGTGSPVVRSGPTGVGFPGHESGGSFDFNHWDLVEAKQVADLRPDYHFIKNYNFLGRLDTLLIKDADAFAIYRASYDAFGDMKPRGIAQPFDDWGKFTGRDKDAWFKLNNLREYYAQVNVTDDLSFRIGKQEIIWSEADALSGTEIINPADLRPHWTHFESAEDLRKNLRMVKMNYVLGDFFHTANNELEAFWIPGDFQGPGFRVNTTDQRQPYMIQLATAPVNPFGKEVVGNMEGQLIRSGNLATFSRTPVAIGNLVYGGVERASGFNVAATSPFIYLDLVAPIRHQWPNNSVKHSEFGARYSTLLPIGNGLQVSLIYEYLYRAEKLGIDQFGPPPPCVPAMTCITLVGPTGSINPLAPNNPEQQDGNNGPGVWATANTTAPNASYANVPGGLQMATNCFAQGGAGAPATMRCGQNFFDLFDEILRANFFGLTGTYYDKDLTDIVFRYDFAYIPRYGYYGHGFVLRTPRPFGIQKAFFAATGGKDQGDWTDQVEGIIAFDRPTYIPWISKQHTFIVVQQTTKWFPGLHEHPTLAFPSMGGKYRTFQNLGLVATVNWLFDGRLVSTNAVAWDEDDRTGFLLSTNAFRYSRNLLFDINAIWYLGQSGRFTDPFIFSRDQRINEAEFRVVYEL